MAVLYLTGVLQDGSPATDPAVPHNPRAELEIIQGTTNQIVCRVVNPSGAPVPPVGTLTLTVKQKPGDEPALAELDGTWTPLLGPGTAVLTWAANAMRYIPWGRYVYDVRLVNGTDIDMVIPASPFRLSPAV